ncbi:MAG TPA: AAA family ATPase [Actinocrinis sp.]|nr:AAA family ATPase [Actinocrinis sp.]
MTDAVQPVPFIKRVRIQNFKSIESCDVELATLTVLVGLNAAGKSNFLDALRFVVDALTNGLQAAIAQRSGPDGLWFEGAHEQPLSIELELDLQRPLDRGHGPATYGFRLGLAEPVSRFRVKVLHEWFTFEREDGQVISHATGDPGASDTGITNLVAGGSDLLLRSLATRSQEIGNLHNALIGISLHSPDPVVMREVKPAEDGTSLGAHGERLGDVLGRIASGWPIAKNRIDAYLASVVPGAVGIDHLDLGRNYSTVQLWMRDLETDEVSSFSPEAISDGTLRAAGVLAALFQPDSLVGYITAVCIDEPELGLHPSAAGMLFYALVEATRHVQVIVATQSGDLLHRDEIDLDWIRPVAMRDGRTVIGPVDSVTREVVRRKLATVGERMRLDQILPAGLEDGE